MTAMGGIVAPLLDWYEANKRDLPWRENPTPYRVWVSEIMLQQTRVEAVRAYFLRFMEALPTIELLAACPEQALLKLWEGLGYYNRVRNLQKAAQAVVDNFGGSLPADYDALLTLNGIGAYTAGAVASIAFGIPVPAVDGNVLRVLARVNADYADIADPKTKAAAADSLRAILPEDRAGAFNQGLMELGATVCVPNGAPACERCPLAALCEGRRRGVMLDLPVKTAKKPRRVEERTILLLVRDSEVALRKRKERGLLAGLWELPSLDGYPTMAAVNDAVRAFGLEPLRVEELGAAKHIFTHIEWQMRGLRVTVEESRTVEGLTWVDPRRLLADYPLPSAFRAYLAPFINSHCIMRQNPVL